MGKEYDAFALEGAKIAAVVEVIRGLHQRWRRSDTVGLKYGLHFVHFDCLGLGNGVNPQRRKRDLFYFAPLVKPVDMTRDTGKWECKEIAHCLRMQKWSEFLTQCGKISCMAPASVWKHEGCVHRNMETVCGK
eukprot:3077354-Rhodomonas_salina.1